MDSMQATRRGRRMFRLLLAIGSLLGSVAFLELYCRWTFHRGLEAVEFSAEDSYYYLDHAGIRRHIPGKVGYERLWNEKGRAEFRINSRGFRGPEVTVPKPAGVRRVLFVGDSITLGGRLPEDQTWVHLAGQRLAVEAVNAGMGDIGLSEEREIFEAGLAVDPDLVVHAWYLNDGRPTLGFREEQIFQNGLMQAFHRHSWLLQSYLVAFAYSRLRDALVRAEVDPDAERFGWIDPMNEGQWSKDPRIWDEVVEKAKLDWGDAWNDASLERMARTLGEMHDSSKARGIAHVVVLLPGLIQVYADHPGGRVDHPQRAMKQRLEARGVKVIDILPGLKKVRNRPLFYDHCHYTPEGNQVVADILARELAPVIESRADRGAGGRTGS